jgi:hypothetical protein
MQTKRQFSVIQPEIESTGLAEYEMKRMIARLGFCDILQDEKIEKLAN